MYTAINLALALFTADIDCLKETLFNISYKDPYTKKYQDPSAISHCVDTADIDNPDHFSVKDTLGNVEVVVEARFDVETSSQKSFAGFYSPFDKKNLVEVGELLYHYRIDEIRDPCFLTLRMRYDKVTLKYYCKIPKSQIQYSIPHNAAH